MVKKLTNYERDRSKDFQPYFELIYQHPSNVEKIQRYVSSRTGCIPIWPYFIKEVNQEKDLTDIQKISNYLELVYQHPDSWECPTNFRKISQNWRYNYICPNAIRIYKPTNRMTNIEEIQNYLAIV